MKSSNFFDGSKNCLWNLNRINIEPITITIFNCNYAQCLQFTIHASCSTHRPQRTEYNDQKRSRLIAKCNNRNTEKKQDRNGQKLQLRSKNVVLWQKSSECLLLFAALKLETNKSNNWWLNNDFAHKYLTVYQSQDKKYKKQDGIRSCRIHENVPLLIFHSKLKKKSNNFGTTTQVEIDFIGWNGTENKTDQKYYIPTVQKN